MKVVLSSFFGISTLSRHSILEDERELDKSNYLKLEINFLCVCVRDGKGEGDGEGKSMLLSLKLLMKITLDSYLMAHKYTIAHSI